MKQFTYTITDPMGIHARPAGKLARAVKAMDSAVTIARADGRAIAARKLMSIVALGVKAGESVTVTVENGNEEANAAALQQFFRENL